MADKKVRGDMNIKAEDKIMISHMIVSDQVSYTWTEGAKTGFKMVADKNAVEDNSSTPPVDQNSAVDINKKMAYNCSPWSKDNSYFELPSSVQFTDLSAMIPAVTPKAPVENKANKPGAENNLKSAQCVACASVPAASQAQCRAALGCN